MFDMVKSSPEREEASRRQRVAALDERIGALCANVDAALAELVAALGEFDELGGWSDQYAHSPQNWLSWRANVAPRQARQWFTLARQLEGLAKVRAAFEDGALTYSQTRIIVGVGTEDTEDILIHLASHSTAAQLQRICSAFRGAQAAQSLEVSNERHDNRMLGYHYEDDGMMHVFARLCPEDAAIFEQALEATAQRLKEEQEENTATKRSHGQRCADALIEIAKAALASDPSDGGAPSNYEVMVHVDLETVAGGCGERADIGGCSAVAAATIERLLCCSYVRAVIEANGELVDLGNRRRHPTKRQRKALELRDQMCRFPGCSATRFRDAHHLDLHSKGGKTKLDRLVLFCSFHHRLFHEGGFRIEGDADDELTFYDLTGTVIENIAPRPPGSVEALIADNRARNPEITSETCRSNWDGTRVDVGACVDAIYADAQPARAGPDPEYP